MKYKRCVHHFCNYPYWRCTNDQSPHFMVNPYDLFKDMRKRNVNDDAREREYKAKRKKCPCQGSWTGRGKNPCKHASWAKIELKVYKYNGYPMTSYETNLLHGMMIKYNAWEILAYYKVTTHKIDWNGIMEQVHKDKSWIYEGDYPKCPADVTIPKSYTAGRFFTKDEHAHLIFLEREYGLYHVLMFIKHTIPKRAWEAIMKFNNTKEFEDRMKVIGRYGFCGSCRTQFVMDLYSVNVGTCPECGWGGY